MRKNDEPNYRLNCGQYVLHRGDTPSGPVMDEVALAISRSEGTLHKHGSVDNVTLWANHTRGKLRAVGDELSQELADDIVVLSGRFPLEELNKCLTNTGYVGHMLRKIEAGQLQQEPLLPSPSRPGTALRTGPASV